MENDESPRPFNAESIREGAGEEKPPPLSEALLTAPELAELPIEQRPKILGEWLREGDYGFVFAPRGDGKTWLAMLIGNAISEAAKLGNWTAGERPRRVVYFDAEMNLPDLKERARLIGIESQNFDWLQHERTIEIWERNLNIADSADQEEISRLLNEGDVLIIDNLSTAAHGIEENNNDHFDRLKSWLLKLRFRKITVIIVHHAGRNGQMRGASRREDIAHWILRLKDGSDEEKGVKAFVTDFSEKCRNCQLDKAPPLRWTISTAEGRLTYTAEIHKGPDAMLGLIREGIGSASELATELNVTPGCISKWAKKLMEAPPQIKKAGREYVAIEAPPND